MLKRIWSELLHHVPFTAIGAVIGIAVMAAISLLNAPTSMYISSTGGIVFASDGGVM